ncbi:hypothetical protein [Aquimarina sp. I32.4]|uniref:hypothetical protein n=1 Tax=Aquimarina sp. I32.4 TaxID=2053903 RepID=UPI000CDF299F|nr:hypothetical protein [Aquimarina sp. I32.4]
MISTQAGMFIPDTATKEEAYYKIDVSQKSIVGGLTEDHYTQYHIKKEWIRTLPSGDTIYVIEVIEREDNATGKLRKIEADIATFTKRIAVQVDTTGKPIYLLNQYAIAEAWQDHRKEFYKKHKDFEDIAELITQTDAFVEDAEQLLEAFLESAIGQVMFPTTYESIDTIENKKTSKVISGCIGDDDVPLILTHSKVSYDREKGKYSIQKDGVLDHEQYNADGVNEFFTDLVGNPIKTAIELGYLESHDFDTSFWITHVFLILNIHIKGVFNYQEIIRVQPNPPML